MFCLSKCSLKEHFISILLVLEAIQFTTFCFQMFPREGVYSGLAGWIPRIICLRLRVQPCILPRDLPPPLPGHGALLLPDGPPPQEGSEVHSTAGDGATSFCLQE